MAVKPYLTSDDLVEAVKRNMAFPIAQVTFDVEDILAFANEELFLEQVPSVMQYHEEFFTFSEDVPLESQVSRYDIPYRAIGLKIRNLFWKDELGNIQELSAINRDDAAHFQYTTANNGQSPYHYYIEANQVVLIPEVQANPTGSLAFTYYLRPNNLVENSRAHVCSYFTKELTVENADLTAGDTLTIGSNQLVAGTNFAIGATSIATASNLNTVLNGLTGIVATVSSNIVVLKYLTRTMTVSNDSDGILVEETIGIESTEAVPTEIIAGATVDLLKTKGGHRTYSIDITVQDSGGNTLTFNEDDIPSNFLVNDYICLQYEAIIPQIPSDLHPLLVERTCARIMGSLGDQTGRDASDKRVERLEMKQATMIDNRTEDSPPKVFNKNSLLRYGRRQTFRGRL